MTINAIIICAGEGERWNNYLGTPKHLLNIEDENLISRTVSLIKKYKRDETKIFAVTRDERYKIPVSILYIPKLNPKNNDAC